MAGGEGTEFGKYYLVKRIASGGMGEIFLAKLRGPVGFEKLLVIKRILQQHLENQDYVDMFFAEARVAAQLSHANIVQIYEMGEIEDCYYIAMEYVHGKSLRDIIERARSRGEHVPPGYVIEIIGAMCSGLSYAHNARDLAGEAIGIVHRDVNPHNLLISYSGEVKIIDFGIAKSEMSMHKTETGTIKGKFVYMSPEQSAAEPLDKRSDLFSVGICLYESLTLQNPFAKANVVLSLDAIQRRDPPPPSEVDINLAPFDDVIRRALSKKAQGRYNDCAELRDALLTLVNEGRVPKPKGILADYMHELFGEDITLEQKAILRTDSGRPQTPPVRRRSGSVSVTKNKVAAARQQTTGVHSRVPFYVILGSIIALSIIASSVVFQIVRRSREARARNQAATTGAYQVDELSTEPAG